MLQKIFLGTSLKVISVLSKLHDFEPKKVIEHFFSGELKKSP